jgi:hypothetical protein
LNNNIWTDGYLLAIEWEEEKGLKRRCVMWYTVGWEAWKEKFMNDLVTSLGIENILNDL